MELFHFALGFFFVFKNGTMKNVSPLTKIEVNKFSYEWENWLLKPFKLWITIKSRSPATMWTVYAMAYTDFWKLLHKNAIKLEFLGFRGKFWDILGLWRTLTFGARGALVFFNRISFIVRLSVIANISLNLYLEAILNYGTEWLGVSFLTILHRGRASSKSQWVQGPQNLSKMTPKFQFLLFIAFLYNNFQKSVGAFAPTAPTVTRPLVALQSRFSCWDTLSAWV